MVSSPNKKKHYEKWIVNNLHDDRFTIDTCPDACTRSGLDMIVVDNTIMYYTEIVSRFQRVSHYAAAAAGRIVLKYSISLLSVMGKILF